jgi:hypothetical protein
MSSYNKCPACDLSISVMVIGENGYAECHNKECLLNSYDLISGDYIKFTFHRHHCVFQDYEITNNYEVIDSLRIDTFIFKNPHQISLSNVKLIFDFLMTCISKAEQNKVLD